MSGTRLKRIDRRKKRVFWILMGLLTLFLVRLASRHTETTEVVYGDLVYPGIRGAFSLLFSWLPFPSLVLVLIYLIWLLYRNAILPLRRREVTAKSFILGVLSTIGALLFFFYFLWGFNYSRPGLTERLDLSPQSLDSLALTQEFRAATEDLANWAMRYDNKIRSEIGSYDISTNDSLSSIIRTTLGPLGYEIGGTPTGRLLRPRGILMRFSTAGIYIPYSGEGHVDAGMLPVQIPFTMAHELGHGYGVTDEGECNFLAYIVCTTSDDPMVRFSGLLAYWRYVAAEYRRFAPEAYKEQYNALPDLVRTTLQSIYENNRKYPDIMPQTRNLVYDTYLRSNGVDGGLVSYNRIVRWVAAYRQMGSR